MGAEKLLGNGDMLFLVPGDLAPRPGPGDVCLGPGRQLGSASTSPNSPSVFSRELTQLQIGGGVGKDKDGLKARDDLYETAIDIIIREGRGSTSLLQRALGIGYGRAARMIDYMCEDGIVSEHKSGSARDVLLSLEEWEALKNGEEAPSTAA